MQCAQGRFRDGGDLICQATSCAATGIISTNMDESLPLAGLKVMVIDDSATIRKSVQIFLAQAGVQVVLAEDGFDALAKVNDYQPAIIFCDITMPRLDGYQTCSLIKKNPKFSATPVVMLSSKDGLFDRARGRLAGSDEYLTKPFTKENFLGIVMAQTTRSRGQA